MKIMIVGHGYGVDAPDTAPAADIICATPVDFMIDYGPMMDRWGGGVAIADIEPYEGNERFYQVVAFYDLPVAVRQTHDAALMLDAIDESWFLELNGMGPELEATSTGVLPSASDPVFVPLWEFLQTFGVAYGDIDEPHSSGSRE